MLHYLRNSFLCRSKFLFKSHIILKQIHDLKNVLGNEGWSYSPLPKVTQPLFLWTDLGEDEENGHGEKQGLPIEYQYESEKERLKHVHELKKDLI